MSQDDVQAKVRALQERFNLGPELRFRASAQGLVCADVRNGRAEASVCLQGAHLASWHPHATAKPVIWLSSDAQFAPGKSIRGGVPLCWPWFGPAAGTGAGGAALPSHGFARTTPWQLRDARHAEGGATELVFGLGDDERTRGLWPHAFAAELRLTIGEQLRVELSTTNTGDAEFTLGEALHTYFQVGDIGAIEIQGLDGLEYADKVGPETRRRQDGPVRFAGEVDRVYVNAVADCTIVDPVLQRRIHITPFGARSTVVWSPWTEKAARMGDMGPGSSGQGGWREMVCVESGNALENVVAVAPGATHRLAVLYRVEG